MFTFGREHEKQHILRDLKKPQDRGLAEDIIDRIHDYLENPKTIQPLHSALLAAFHSGGSGVWESAGCWLRKLQNEDPSFASIWLDLAQSSSWQTRFRTACFLGDIPSNQLALIVPLLTQDKSLKVQNMAKARLQELSS